MQLGPNENKLVCLDERPGVDGTRDLKNEPPSPFLRMIQQPSLPSKKRQCLLKIDYQFSDFLSRLRKVKDVGLFLNIYHFKYAVDNVIL